MRLSRGAPTLILVLMIACATGGTGTLPPTLEGSGWRTLAPMPTPRTEVAGAARRGRIFVIGGFAETGGTVSAVEVYRIDLDEWSAAPDLPLAVNHAMAAATEDGVYVVGGYTDGLQAPSDRAFVLRAGKWHELPNLPASRAAGGAVAIGRRVYVVGGVTDDGLARSAFMYRPGADRWRKLPGLKQPRQHLGAASAGGKIVVVAGREGGLDSNLDEVDLFSARDRSWQGMPAAPTVRGGLAAAGWDDSVIAAGGEGPDGTFDEVEVFDVNARTWSALPPLPTPRHGLAVVVSGDILYVIGGGPEPGLTYSSVNEALRL
jgi:N-acetylneuraminic acid mutarotase